jgi:hypothetical protein
LSVKEVISAEFTLSGTEEKMPCGHSYCPSGSGKTYLLTVDNSHCKVISSYFDRLGNKICDTSSIFENSLGGKVIVFAQTLYGNLSQSIYNYPRQRLIQRLIQLTADEFVTCGGEPNLWVIVNKPNKSKSFKRLITISNLGLDDVDRFTLRIPKCVGEIKGVQVLCANGRWKKAKYSVNGQNIVLEMPLRALGIEYIRIV